MDSPDMVKNPPHYNQHKHEVIELSEQFDFCMGNVIKYVLRAPYKGNKKQDLEKALWYLDRFIGSNLDEYVFDDLFENEEMRELITSFESPLLVAILSEPTGAGRAALLNAIKDAEIEDLKKRLEAEKAKYEQERKEFFGKGLSDYDWEEINKIFRQADQFFKKPEKEWWEKPIWTHTYVG